jgi:hypothetical protein
MSDQPDQEVPHHQPSLQSTRSIRTCSLDSWRYYCAASLLQPTYTIWTADGSAKLTSVLLFPSRGLCVFVEIMEHDRRDVCLGMDGLAAATGRSCVCPVSSDRFSSCHGLGPTSIMQGPTGSWAISCVLAKALKVFWIVYQVLSWSIEVH